MQTLAAAAAVFALLFCPRKAVHLSLSELTDSSGKGGGGGGNHYLLRVQCIPDSVVEYIVQSLLESAVAPRAVLVGFVLPVNSASQEHLCKQFLREAVSGDGGQGKTVMLGRKERQP